MGLFDFLKKKKNTAQENAVSNVKEEVRKEAVINSDESGNTDTETIETIEKVVEPVKVEPAVEEKPLEVEAEIEEEPTETEPVVEEKPIQAEPVVAEEPTEVEPEVKEEPVKVEPVVEEKPVKVEPEVKEEPVKVEPVVEEKPVEVEPELKEELVETEPVVEEEPIEAEPTVEEPVQEKKLGFFAKIKSGLSKTRDNILSSVDNVLKSFVKIDEDLFEELEEALIMADIGVETSLYIIEKLREKVKDERVTDPSEVKGLLVNVISEILEKDDEPLNMPSPTVILVIGVNGVGKTTTIGKLAHNYLTEGKTVLLAAADTFRAAAIDQLQIWGDRNNCEVIKHQENSDPAAVVFDAVNAAKARKTDILICDTAGRLHNKKNLMEELRKIAKVIDREYPEAHTEVFLVLDATTGQNAIQQAKLFKEVANITGLVLTKLDGTAKGGIVLAIKHDMNIPVRYIGVGEQINDLQPFNSKDFSKALFDEE